MRNGVATGYNPTDYFRAGAVRSIVSIDPASLKTRRQGSVMLRGQSLWDSGSLTAMFSPKLAKASRRRRRFNPDFGATNHRRPLARRVSQKIGGRFTPQVILLRKAGCRRNSAST